MSWNPRSATCKKNRTVRANSTPILRLRLKVTSKLRTPCLSARTDAFNAGPPLIRTKTRTHCKGNLAFQSACPGSSAILSLRGGAWCSVGADSGVNYEVEPTRWVSGAQSYLMGKLFFSVERGLPMHRTKLDLANERGLSARAHLQLNRASTSRMSCITAF